MRISQRSQNVIRWALFLTAVVIFVIMALILLGPQINSIFPTYG